MGTVDSKGLHEELSRIKKRDNCGHEKSPDCITCEYYSIGSKPPMSRSGLVELLHRVIPEEYYSKILKVALDRAEIKGIIEPEEDRIDNAVKNAYDAYDKYYSTLPYGMNIGYEVLILRMKKALDFLVGERNK